MEKTPLIVFASGSATGGGSGFKNLVEVGRRKRLAYEVVCVVTHHQNGGVARHAQALNIPCQVVTTPVSGADYQNLMRACGAEKASLSGWLKSVTGLPTEKVINIHPGPLPEFGGHGMYGHHVHEAVIRQFKKEKIRASAVSMHFVVPYVRYSAGQDNYDTGPLFAQVPVPILANDTAETLAQRVNATEHAIQPIYTSLVCEGKIALVGNRVTMLSNAWLCGRELPLL
jgi:phosphoribosylglycinamide formyltransferase-1